MSQTRMLVAYHAGTKTTFSLSDPVLLVDYMQLTEKEREQLDEGSLPDKVLYEKSIRLDNWRASEFFDHELNGGTR